MIATRPTDCPYFLDCTPQPKGLLTAQADELRGSSCVYGDNSQKSRERRHYEAPNEAAEHPLRAAVDPKEQVKYFVYGLGRLYPSMFGQHLSLD